MAAFHAELVVALRPLLPAGASVLEAGCGAGFQSLALARDGGFRVSLLDISEQALGAARRVFDAAGVPVEATHGDAFAAGEPAHDLVFNAGVLEHYTLDQQAAFLRGMASRSRRYVLALVPNRLCYWYWLWRVRSSSDGRWPYGKECPEADLEDAFRAAGLTYLGRTYLGSDWTEDLIADTRGLSSDLRRDLLTVHRGGLIESDRRCYLTAALGCVGPAPAAPLPGWQAGWQANEMRTAELTAGLADALAAGIAAAGRERDTAARADEAVAAARAELEQARVALATFRESGAYRLASRILRLKAYLGGRAA
jgi:SAM-dependent methyltransferase